MLDRPPLLEEPRAQRLSEKKQMEAQICSVHPKNVQDNQHTYDDDDDDDEDDDEEDDDDAGEDEDENKEDGGDDDDADDDDDDVMVMMMVVMMMIIILRVGFGWYFLGVFLLSFYSRRNLETSISISLQF